VGAVKVYEGRWHTICIAGIIIANVGIVLYFQDANLRNQQDYKKKFPAMRPYNLFVGKQQANYGLKFVGGSIVSEKGGGRRPMEMR
jgi:hypothetical protein